VAQRSGESRSERGAEAAPALPVSPASARHVPTTLATRQLAHGKRVIVGPTRATIAPRACARDGGCGAAVISLAKMAGTGSQDVVELLQRVPVFSTLEHGDLERIAQLAVPRSFQPGEVVFHEGDASDTCYIVREGRARAVRTHRDGRTITLARFGPGDIFGELALFEDEKRSATVEAIEPLSVCGLLGPDMRRLLSRHAEISSRLVIALGRRLRETNERLSRQSFQTVQSRVAVVLSQLVEQEGGDGPGDVLVTATQADLAQLAGSSRESASRFLAVLERAGVISQGRGRLVVHDPQALKQYVF
jgi:CRP-like cAMP-binding protein